MDHKITSGTHVGNHKSQKINANPFCDFAKKFGLVQLFARKTTSGSRKDHLVEFWDEHGSPVIFSLR
jgi:hypothetical protein